MKKLVLLIGLFLIVTAYLEAQTVKSVFNTRYPMLANVYKSDGSNEVNDENIDLYREQYQKLKEGYKEINMFEFDVVDPESYKLFEYKELKQLGKDAKIDSLKNYMSEYQKGVKCLLKDKSKYGADSSECVEQYSNLSRLLKEKDYLNAYKAWKTLFVYYPLSFKGVYIQGDLLIRNLIKTTHNNAVEANKQRDIDKTKALLAEEQAWIDTLLLVYDQRIKYFGDSKTYGEPYLIGKKGIYIFKYRKNEQLDTAYTLLKHSVETEKNKANPDVIQHYFFASNEMYNASKIDAAQVVADYDLSMESLQGNIDYLKGLMEKHPTNKRMKSWKEAVGLYEKIYSNLTKKFSQGTYATCENLIPVYEGQYETHKEDKKWLTSVTDILNMKSCTESDIYEKAAVGLYTIEPSPEAAYKLGQLYLKKEKYEMAAKYYEEAYTNETDPETKGKYYYDAAVIANVMRQYSKSRTLALTAAQNKKDNGDVYILIAKLYAASASSCGEDNFEHSQAYWLAVDKLNYAKSIDPSVAAKANGLINKYSSLFPSKEEGFMRSIYEGNTVTIGCWIQENTKARYLK